MTTASSSRAQLIQRILHAGVIAVIRAPSAEIVEPLAEALISGGVSALEITTSTPNFAVAVRRCHERFGNSALVGAGTLLDAGIGQRAVEAGAQFLVSPIGNLELIAVAHRAEVPVALGAMTPTEAQRIHASKGDFVKLFPAEVLGLPFIRAVQGPLPHLRLIPTGGIDVRNAGEYRRAGCVAIGVGSSLVRPDWVERRDWRALTEAAAALVQAWRNA